MASPALLDIEVDSSLSAQENANRYFLRFKKLARQANHVEALLDQTVCSRMLTYAHVCSRMLTYAHICSRML
jgi:hypothetical protein